MPHYIFLCAVVPALGTEIQGRALYRGTNALYIEAHIKAGEWAQRLPSISTCGLLYRCLLPVAIYMYIAVYYL